MAKLSLLLAMSQLALVYALPTRDVKQQTELLNKRAITISTNLDITTSYSTAIESLQTATLTIRPSLTGVLLVLNLCICSKADFHTECHNGSPFKRRHH